MAELSGFEQSRRRAKALAAEWVASPWYEAAVNAWPAPVAHQIEAMAAVLEGEPYHVDGGDAGAALLSFAIRPRPSSSFWRSW